MRLDQNIKYRDADKVLRHNGYERCSCTGSHFKYKNSAENTIIVPRKLNPVIWKRLIKENHLVTI